MALPTPNTDPRKGRPMTEESGKGGAETNETTKALKGLEDIETEVSERLKSISGFLEVMKNYVPKLGFIDAHIAAIKLSTDQIKKDIVKLVDAMAIPVGEEEDQDGEAEDLGAGEKLEEGLGGEDGEKLDPEKRGAPETMGQAIAFIQEDVQAIRMIMEEDSEGIQGQTDKEIEQKTGGLIKNPEGGGDGGPKKKGMMDGIMKQMKAFFGMIKKFFIIGILLVGVLFTASNDLFSGLKELFMNLFAIFKKIVEVVFQTVVPIITQLATVIIDVINMLMPPIMSLIDTMVPMITQIIETVMGIIMAVVDALMPIIQAFIDILVPIIEMVLNNFMLIFEYILAPLLSLLVPIIETVASVVMFFFNLFIAIFNGIIEFIAKLASIFGYGDEVRAMKIQKDESAEASEDIDFAQDDEAVDAQIQAKLDAGEINEKTAESLRKDKEKFREKQQERRSEMIDQIGAERVTEVPEALKEDGKGLNLVKMDLTEQGLGEVFVDPAPKADGTYNVYNADGEPIDYAAVEAEYGDRQITPIITAALEGLEAEASGGELNTADLAAAFGGSEVSADSLDTAEAQADAAAAGAGGGGGTTAMASVNSNQNVSATTHNVSSGGSNPTGGRGGYFTPPGV